MALVRRIAALVHRVEDAPVHGLQAVARVGQRARHDHAHRVIEVAALHLIDDGNRLDIARRRRGFAAEAGVVLIGQGRWLTSGWTGASAYPIPCVKANRGDGCPVGLKAVKIKVFSSLRVSVYIVRHGAFRNSRAVASSLRLKRGKSAPSGSISVSIRRNSLASGSRPDARAASINAVVSMCLYSSTSAEKPSLARRMCASPRHVTTAWSSRSAASGSRPKTARPSGAFSNRRCSCSHHRKAGVRMISEELTP